MKLNDVFNAINVEQILAGVEKGSGTFKELLDDTLAGKITPLVMNDSTIVGVNYVSGKTGIEDTIEGMKFEARYRGRPITSWLLSCFKIRFSEKTVSEVVETENLIKVVFSDGTEEVIYDGEEIDDPECENIAEEELPSRVTITAETLNNDLSTANIKRYLRDAYNHYLAAGADLTIGETEDGVIVSNIIWGRKR